VTEDARGTGLPEGRAVPDTILFLREEALMSNATDKEEMERILREEDVGRLGLAADDEPYVVPLNYTYADGRALFHCALEGRKLDVIRKNPNVCFEVSRQEGRPAEHAGDLCSAPFESVICYGVARIVDDLQERLEVLNEFQTRFGTLDKPRTAISEERAAKCGAVVIRVVRMTGRRSGEGKTEWLWEAPPE